MKGWGNLSFPVADPGEEPGGGGASLLPLFLDTTEARRPKRFLLETAPPRLSKGLDAFRPPTPLSQGLDPALISVCNMTQKG